MPSPFVSHGLRCPDMTDRQRANHYTLGCRTSICTIAARAFRSRASNPDIRGCWRCGIDFTGSEHLARNAPCVDCRDVLRALGETTVWRARASADVERTQDPARVARWLYSEDTAA